MEPRTRLAEALAELPGVEVEALATHGVSVMREIEETRPEVVILDVQMPQGGALGLIHQIKSALKPPIVIALSSVSSRMYRSKCRNVGAELFFDKVSETEALLRAVSEIRNGLER